METAGRKKNTKFVTYLCRCLPANTTSLLFTIVERKNQCDNGGRTEKAVEWKLNLHRTPTLLTDWPFCTESTALFIERSSPRNRSNEQLTNTFNIVQTIYSFPFVDILLITQSIPFVDIFLNYLKASYPVCRHSVNYLKASYPVPEPMGSTSKNMEPVEPYRKQYRVSTRSTFSTCAWNLWNPTGISTTFLHAQHFKLFFNSWMSRKGDNFGIAGCQSPRSTVMTLW